MYNKFFLHLGMLVFLPSWVLMLLRDRDKIKTFWIKMAINQTERCNLYICKIYHTPKKRGKNISARLKLGFTPAQIICLSW